MPAAEGDCTTPSFGFFGYALWDHTQPPIKIDSGLGCFNMPSCDVKVSFPSGNAPALYYIVPKEGGGQLGFLVVFGIKTIFEDCG